VDFFPPEKKAAVFSGGGVGGPGGKKAIAVHARCPCPLPTTIVSVSTGSFACSCSSSPTCLSRSRKRAAQVQLACAGVASVDVRTDSVSRNVRRVNQPSVRGFPSRRALPLELARSTMQRPVGPAPPAAWPEHREPEASNGPACRTSNGFAPAQRRALAGPRARGPHKRQCK